MDWEMPFDLRPLTVDVEFTLDSRPFCKFTTWAGLLGVFTGIRYPSEECPESGWAVAVNYRRAGDGLLANFVQLLSYGSAVSYAVKDIVLSVPDYKEARLELSTRRLISPAYFTIVGTWQGSVMTRSRLGLAESSRETDLEREVKCLVQCNADACFEPAFRGSPNQYHKLDTHGRSFARNLVAQTAAATITDSADHEAAIQKAWSLLSSFPIANQRTLYSTVACPAINYYQSQVGERTELQPDEPGQYNTPKLRHRHSQQGAFGVAE